MAVVPQRQDACLSQEWRSGVGVEDRVDKLHSVSQRLVVLPVRVFASAFVCVWVCE